MSELLLQKEVFSPHQEEQARITHKNGSQEQDYERVREKYSGNSEGGVTRV